MLTFPKQILQCLWTTETAIISHWHLIKKDLSLSSIPIGKQIPEINTILLKNEKQIMKLINQVKLMFMAHKYRMDTGIVSF